MLQLELLYSQGLANFLLEVRKSAHNNDIFLEIGSSNSSTLVAKTEVSSLNRRKCIIVIFPLSSKNVFLKSTHLFVITGQISVIKKPDSLGISSSLKLLVQGITANKKFKYHTVCLN